MEFKLQGQVLQTLCASDEKLAMLIHSIGDYELNVRTDYFPSLVRSIIGQQLSVTVAQTIWQRTLTYCKNISPEDLISKTDGELRALGISRSKARYIKDLSQKLLNGELNLNVFDTLPDHEVIGRLIMMKGIGIWTAEMFLIFSLGRLDVFSTSDIGLKRAIQWLYGLKQIPSDPIMNEYAMKWIPYRSVASLYLWEIINQGLIRLEPKNLKPKF